ncbi:carbohydrate ABC transporter permease [Rhizobium sp. SL86]|jgi:multiple sugar transport system permease protein|uniref:carbohydrate ABC transporter permease n=1 Tax=Rhizobium sp. SL86 TaxID=2995148 RepID=UPI002275342F|nr:sugar ABC transporter permease [Rhizobium sp. SL86]MCY1667284.1 sugar ABC transporter permease [Rhizobium sp. SL86]
MTTTPQAAPNGAAGGKRLPKRRPRKTPLSTAIIPWLFLAPALVIFTWFKFYPMVSGFSMSFYNVQFYADSEWVGLDNFYKAFDDPDLRLAVFHTTIYVIVATLGASVTALCLALFLEGPARHLRIIRTAIFLPAITSVAIIAEIWRILFNSADYGIINATLGFLGVAPQGFLSDPDQALWVLILMSIWKSAPYDMVIFVAGLVGINRELYDAASVDGASPWRKFWHVTIPGIIPSISVVVMLSFIRGFRIFAEVYATTGGGPAGSTATIMTHVYKVGFEELNYGYASAVSLLLLLFTVALTLVHMKIKSRFTV